MMTIIIMVSKLRSQQKFSYNHNTCHCGRCWLLLSWIVLTDWIMHSGAWPGPGAACHGPGIVCVINIFRPPTHLSRTTNRLSAISHWINIFQADLCLSVNNVQSGSQGSQVCCRGSDMSGECLYLGRCCCNAWGKHLAGRGGGGYGDCYRVSNIYWSRLLLFISHSAVPCAWCVVGSWDRYQRGDRTPRDKYPRSFSKIEEAEDHQNTH